MLSFLKGKDKDQKESAEPSRSWTQRLRDGLAATREKLGGQLKELFTSSARIDESFYEELETILISCDVGVAATRHLIDATRARVRKSGAATPEAVRDELKAALADLVAPLERPFAIGAERPFVILLCGVNGAGKTTSIGKLAHLFQAQGHSVLLAAGDTFRAAAREQLAEWGSRNNVTVVSQQSGDPGAVIFDAVQSAAAKGITVVLADTAGRLPTQLHLMEELKKVRRVTHKAMEGAPHETLLVLDANTGQNAVAQVKAFDDAIGLSGLVLTKLDGTAKGGVIAAIARERPVPVRFIGVGESLEDLRPFEARAFVDAMID
ncbi:MAG: signal recognition particle-docking protein FtsY [Betaproteobacteria bacterium]|nr:signal recognition particle-docking protein FtsY [Betaproteobacteria bacterium]MBL8534735.1 signal recognition particle-docking protein FtsY [Betaproteobacteria bacterium]